eukprot:987863_1
MDALAANVRELCPDFVPHKQNDGAAYFLCMVAAVEALYNAREFCVEDHLWCGDKIGCAERKNNTDETHVRVFAGHGKVIHMIQMYFAQECTPEGWNCPNCLKNVFALRKLMVKQTSISYFLDLNVANIGLDNQYRLIGILVKHDGDTGDSGHFISYIFEEGTDCGVWLRANDMDIDPVSVIEVLDSVACVLIYRRIDCDNDLRKYINVQHDAMEMWNKLLMNVVTVFNESSDDGDTSDTNAANKNKKKNKKRKKPTKDKGTKGIYKKAEETVDELEKEIRELLAKHKGKSNMDKAKMLKDRYSCNQMKSVIAKLYDAMPKSVKTKGENRWIKVETLKDGTYSQINLALNLVQRYLI